MIKVYPIQIEAIDDVSDLVFKLTTFDEYTAELTIKTLVNADMLPELFEALNKAMLLLELKSGY